MKLPFLHILFFLLIPFGMQAQKAYVQAKAKPGDGIYVFLGRYGLDQSHCNIEHFCRLNNLSLKSYLIADKTYLLPIEKFVFDGKSIESSLNKNDNILAKQVERYNRMMCQFNLKPEDFTKGRKELWCPHHLLSCAVSTDKFVPLNRKFDIFGKKYAEVPLTDKKLAGAVYYIVAGHGGPDPGAMSIESGKSICEDEYAYDISLRLGRELLKHGAIVHFITEDTDGIRDQEILVCDSDETVLGNLNIPFVQKDRLKQRSDLINSMYRKHKNSGIDYQRAIEIHIDSRKKNDRVDLFFYYFPNSSRGKALATLIYNTVKNKYAKYRKNGQYEGVVMSRDLHVLREVIPTTVFVEVANIQNSLDRKRILLPSNRQLVAEWLAEGLMKDY
jgi:N-acetylmuramoyl-L-alanine amidase